VPFVAIKEAPDVTLAVLNCERWAWRLPTVLRFWGKYGVQGKKGRRRFFLGELFRLSDEYSVFFGRRSGSSSSFGFSGMGKRPSDFRGYESCFRDTPSFGPSLTVWVELYCCELRICF
jgi:hypothetical protein